MRDERTPRQTPGLGDGEGAASWRGGGCVDRFTSPCLQRAAETALINVFDGRRVTNSPARLVSTR